MQFVSYIEPFGRVHVEVLKTKRIKIPLNIICKQFLSNSMFSLTIKYNIIDMWLACKESIDVLIVVVI